MTTVERQFVHLSLFPLENDVAKFARLTRFASKAEMVSGKWIRFPSRRGVSWRRPPPLPPAEASVVASGANAEGAAGRNVQRGTLIGRPVL